MRDAISRLDMREKSIPQRITVSFFFFFFKLSKKNIYLFFFFMVMVNLGSTDDSRYTGYREITDRDVLDLQCSNPLWLELPPPQTNFHGPKGV